MCGWGSRRGSWWSVISLVRGALQERWVVGDTPNLAARLHPPTLIAQHAQLWHLFELDLGPDSVRARSAVRKSSQESRFEALHAGGLTPLVGREEESELLQRRWAMANAGEGQVVLLSGEAGIGKSRLTAAFLERLAGEPHVRLRYFCSPQHTDSALHPIIVHMERAAGLAREDSAKPRLDKLDALLAASAISREDAALFAEMLSLPNDGRHPALDLTPQHRRQKTLEALNDWIETIARRTPVLMIFEDAHWADPSSLEVFAQLVDKIDALRVLLCVTFRPEFAAPWVGRENVTLVTINRLTAREVAAVIDRVAGDRPLAESIRQDIVERADGIPLFVEEMTKAVLEAEGEGAAVRAIASVPPPALAVPASLHASLMARLDRLGPAKAIAQIGAAIGREFSHTLCSDRRRAGTAIPQRRGEPARAVGASLHPGGSDREGGGPLGQGGTAIVGAFSAFGGRGAADPCADRDCGVARHADVRYRVRGPACDRERADAALTERLARLDHPCDAQRLPQRGFRHALPPPSRRRPDNASSTDLTIGNRANRRLLQCALFCEIFGGLI